MASRHKGYRALSHGPGITFPDGAPVAWVLRATHKGHHVERVRGPSFFEAVLAAGLGKDIRHYLVGGSERTLELMMSRLRRDFPDIKVAGAFSPPFGELTPSAVDNIVRHVERVDADIFWIGMGTPKQDYVADALANRLKTTAIGVGAAFDFYAGTLSSAPAWMQDNGLEWLYRLGTEPKRLWRRYLFGNSHFSFLAGLHFGTGLMRRVSRRARNLLR